MRGAHHRTAPRQHESTRVSASRRLTTRQEVRRVKLPTFETTLLDRSLQRYGISGPGNTSPEHEYQLRFIQALRETGGLCKRAIGQIRLIEPATAAYLLSYPKNYARCLSAVAVSCTVTTNVLTATTSELPGDEIARSEGYTINSNFNVNKEFEATFRNAGTIKPNDCLASVADQQVANGRISAANQRVRKMMRDYGCNSGVIERMEDGMLSLKRSSTSSGLVQFKPTRAPSVPMARVDSVTGHSARQ